MLSFPPDSIKEYFIWWDDGEYSTRILQKYEGYLCGKSVVYHYMNENKGVDLISEGPARVDRHFYDIRNKFYVAFFSIFNYVSHPQST